MTTNFSMNRAVRPEIAAAIAKCGTEHQYLEDVKNGTLQVLNVCTERQRREALDFINLVNAPATAKAIIEKIADVLKGKVYAAYIGGNMIIINSAFKIVNDNEVARMQLMAAYQGFKVAQTIRPDLDMVEVEKKLQATPHAVELLLAQLSLVAELDKTGRTTSASSATFKTLTEKHGVATSVAREVLFSILSKWGWKENAERFFPFEI